MKNRDLKELDKLYKNSSRYLTKDHKDYRCYICDRNFNNCEGGDLQEYTPSEIIRDTPLNRKRGMYFFLLKSLNQ